MSMPVTWGAGAPQPVQHFWNWGGRIFDLGREHLDRVQEMIAVLPSKPREIVDAEAQLAETQAVRRLARAMEISEEVALHQWARGEFWPTTWPGRS